MNKTTLVGLDCGSSMTGIIALTEKGIREGYNIPNEQVFDFILNEKKHCKKMIVVIEDVRPYNMRITNGIIYTIKFIGQIEWRLKEAGITFELIPRWEVKQWIFTKYRKIAYPEIVKKIEYSHKRKEKANEDFNPDQQPSFVYVDDRIVQRAMRTLWKIPMPKVGQTAAYGLKDHSWQALGVISLYIALCKPAGISKLATFGTWSRKPSKASRKHQS